MNLITARARALNSLLFIKDTRTKDLPIINGQGSVWTTASCVAVSCMPDCDGPTEVMIGNPSDIKNTSGKLIFDAFLDTPNKCVSVETVLAEKIIEKKVSNATTHVRIWTDGFRDTSKIVISLE
jgi:hypothetical protein